MSKEVRLSAGSGQAGKTMVRLLLILWGIAVLFPLIWTVYTSFKNNREFYQSAWALPSSLNFVNYANAWASSDVASAFLNSVFVTAVATLISLLMAATSGYVIGRFSFRGGKALYLLYIASMMIPQVLGIIPLFFLLNAVHMSNSLSGLSLVYAVGGIPIGVFILTEFFRALPRELHEAASVDGSGPFRTFFRIMLPLALPGLITVGILHVLNFWNEYFVALVLLHDPVKYTLPVSISYLYQETQYKTDWGALFAALVISIIPVLIIYAFFQRQITDGMVAGSVKG